MQRPVTRTRSPGLARGARLAQTFGNEPIVVPATVYHVGRLHTNKILPGNRGELKNAYRAGSCDVLNQWSLDVFNGEEFRQRILNAFEGECILEMILYSLKEARDTVECNRFQDSTLNLVQ